MLPHAAGFRAGARGSGCVSRQPEASGCLLGPPPEVAAKGFILALASSHLHTRGPDGRSVIYGMWGEPPHVQAGRFGLDFFVRSTESP
jgi:hypothetical protein